MKRILFIILSIAFVSCSGRMETPENYYTLPDIFPDYKNVTIPPNIAPLNFSLLNGMDGFVRFDGKDYSFEVQLRDGKTRIPSRRWRRMLDSCLGSEISVTVTEREKGRLFSYLPFEINVVTDKVDPYIVYRLIDPGYELWNEMGIYQRSLEDNGEKALFKNSLTDLNCVNCHSFPNNNPDQMSIHLRAIYPGTYLIQGDEIEKIEIGNDIDVASLVYPSWHPTERYIAYSTNDTKQGFHINDLNRIEVYDRSSDIIIYDTEKQELITSSLLFSETSFETFPSFSPDGNSLYYCSAPAVAMPDSFKVVHYDLLRIDFDPVSGSFGDKVDTVFNSADTCSVSFPRVSPDGDYLLFTLSDYGNFSIWHKEADLNIIDLATGKLIDSSVWNSDETESYHSWSSNGRWVVFSSRRGTGLYTRPYFGYIDKYGNLGKPFLLPQNNVDHYKWLMKSYNIPEFITAPSGMDAYQLKKKAKSGDVTTIKSLVKK